MASPADVPARVPHFCARLHLQHVEEGMLEGFSQGDALGRLVLQHALDEVEKAVVVLGLRVQVALGSGRGQVTAKDTAPRPVSPFLGRTAKLWENWCVPTIANPTPGLWAALQSVELLSFHPPPHISQALPEVSVSSSSSD